MARTPAKKPEKVYIVEAPVKDYVGVGAAGIHFANGKAEVKEGWVLNWFKKHGYKVTEKDGTPAKDDPPAEKVTEEDSEEDPKE